MSERFATGRIDNIYFTSDGSASGVPCRVLVEGIEAFDLNVGFTHRTSEAGDVQTQMVEFQPGRGGNELKIIFEYEQESQMTALRTLLKNKLLLGQTVALQIDYYISITGQFKPVMTPQGGLFTFESRSGGMLRSCSLTFKQISS